MRAWWRWALPLACALGLSALSLNTGLCLDDWMHRAILRRTIDFASPSELYAFAPGDPAVMQRYIENGPYPWFTLPELKIRFFRPLSVKLHAFDEAVLRGSAPLEHLHSMGWGLAFVGVAMALYRRLIPGAWAIAAVLFAIDDSHILPVAWVSNRNAVVSCVFGSLALWAHLKWRVDGRRIFAIAMPVLAALALAAGETAVGVLAFIVAFEAFGAPGGARAKVKGLLPLAGVMAAYLVIYRLTNSGVYGSGSYVDPLRSPGAWLVNAPGRGLAMLGGWSSGISSDFWLNLPPSRPFLIALGVGTIALWAWFWRRWLSAREEAAALRWLVPGAVLALLPPLSTFPAERLLIAPSLGLCALVAVLARAVWERRGTGLGKLALAWGVAVFLLQPVMSWFVVTRVLTLFSTGTMAAVQNPNAQRGRVMVLASSDFLPPFHGPLALVELGLPLPTAWQVLSMAPWEHRLTRTGERTFTLEVVGGRMLDTVFEQNARDEAHPLNAGTKVHLDQAEVSVLESQGGHPTKLGVELGLPASGYHFVVWDGRLLSDATLPEVGATSVIPRAPATVEVGLGVAKPLR